MTSVLSRHFRFIASPLLPHVGSLPVGFGFHLQSVVLSTIQHLCLSHPFCLSHLHTSPTLPIQASSNGGLAYSLPSTPVVPHREQGVGGATPRPMRSIPRRPSLFKVRLPPPSSSSTSTSARCPSHWTPCPLNPQPPHQLVSLPVFFFFYRKATLKKRRQPATGRASRVPCVAFPSNR